MLGYTSYSGLHCLGVTLVPAIARTGVARVLISQPQLAFVSKSSPKESKSLGVISKVVESKGLTEDSSQS